MQIATEFFQNYYPEILAKSNIINVPFGSNSLWGIVKIIIVKKTADKFEICSDNRHKLLVSLINVTGLPKI